MHNKIPGLIFLLIVAWLATVTNVCAQSQAEAKQLMTRLQSEIPDSARMEILLKLATYQVKKPGERKADLDSAAGFIASAETLNKKLNSNKYKGQIALTSSYLNEENGQKAKGKALSESAINIFMTGGNNTLLGEAYSQHSRFFPQDNTSYHLIDEDLEKAVFYFHKGGNFRREAETRLLLADFLTQTDDIPKAKNELLQGLKIESASPGYTLYAIYNLLGSIYQYEGTYNEALKYQLLAYRNVSQHLPGSELLCTVCNGLANTYVYMNDNTSALYYMYQAFGVSKKLNDVNNIYLIGSNVTTILMAMGRYHEALKLLQNISANFTQPGGDATRLWMYDDYMGIFTYLKMFPEAQVYCTKYLELLQKVGDREFLANKYTSVIRFYTATKQFGAAAKYLNLQTKQLQKGKRMQLILTNQRLRISLDTARHDYKSATVQLFRYQFLSDSLINEKKIKEISNLEVEYGTERKEAAIKLQDQNIRMLRQKAQLQESDLKKASLTRIFMIAGSLLLAVILVLLVYQNRLKQVTNKTITEKNEAMEKLLKEKESLLDDKEILIREVHHRVKNNLHMISSLLESQSAYLENEALLAIQKSQHRVHAISLIHQKLYLNDKITDVPMSPYLREIVSYLRDSFVIGEQIIFNLSIDQIALDVAQAVPVGLIVNEAITNAVKYAFQDGRNGRIEISMKQSLSNEITLLIADNGIGLPKEFNEGKKNSKSLGLTLIKGLAKSLRGELTINSYSGTRVKVIFFNDHKSDQ